jgi:hypothetical protein
MRHMAASPDRTKLAITRIPADTNADTNLGIATTSQSGGLTRLEPFPPQDISKGTLVTKLIPPFDSDADGLPDPADPCPPPDPDPDCDDAGFSDRAELYMGTHPFLACAADITPMNEHPDPWPPDADDDRDADIGDLIPGFGRGIILSSCG